MNIDKEPPMPKAPHIDPSLHWAGKAEGTTFTVSTANASVFSGFPNSYRSAA
jgi:hypothetical protein